MKTLRSVISIILLTSMLISAVSCGTAKKEIQQTTNAVLQDSTVTTTETSSEMPIETQDPATVPEIPNVTYDGYTYTVANSAIGDGKYTSATMFSDLITGDVYEDAVYERTLLIEELFQIDLEEVYVSPTELINTVLSGTDEFDLHTATLSNIQAVVKRQCAYDLNEIDALCMEKAWWDQNACEKLSFDGKLYYTFSDFVIYGIDNARATYFNKTLHHQLGLEDLYKLTAEGKWTYDKMGEMAKIAVSDLNGDGVIAKDDQLGIVDSATTFYEAMLTGCGAEIVQMGNDGLPYFFMYDHQEKFVEVYQALLSTFSADSRLLKTSGGLDIFKQDKTLFCISTVAVASMIRGEKLEFGILPVPKWDEMQENYLNVSPNGHAFMIPTTVQNIERAGNILEALSYYSSKYYSEDATMQTYFEKALTTKSVRDDESASSLDIIHDNISYVIKIVSHAINVYAQFDADNMNISSIIKANEKVQKKKLEQAIAELGAE